MKVCFLPSGVLKLAVGMLVFLSDRAIGTCPSNVFELVVSKSYRVDFILSHRGEALEGVEVAPTGMLSAPAYSDQSGMYQIQLPVDEHRQSYGLKFRKDSLL